MSSRVTLWQEVIFENAELLCYIKCFLFWSCSPQRCLTCCWAEMNAADCFGRFLLTCRFLSNCDLNASGSQWDTPLGRAWVQPERGIALARLRFLREVNLRNHRSMQRAVWQSVHEAEQGRARMGIRLASDERRHLMLTVRAAHIVEVYYCEHHRLHPITARVPIAHQLHGSVLPL